MTADKLATTQPGGDPFTAFLERAARDPSIDVDKLERLLAMKRDQDDHVRRQAFAAALARLQAKIAPIAKSGENLHTKSRYARLDDMLVVLREPCASEGFAFTFDSDPVPNGIRYSCTMMHEAGHREVKTLTLPTDGTGSQGGRSGMNAIQAVGSTTSYARRYLLEMHLNLIKRDEDDDGNGGPKCVTAEQAAELRAKLADAGGKEDRFLNWAAAASFEQIPATNYQRCLTAIDVIARRAK